VLFLYDVGYGVAASTLGGIYIEEGLKCTSGGAHGPEKGGGFDLCSEQPFCVSGFWFPGNELCPENKGIEDCGKERETKFICIGLDFVLMLIQWTIDINQYFVIFIDSESDSDKNRGVERTRGDRELGWNGYFKVLRNVTFEPRVLSSNWSIPLALNPTSRSNSSTRKKKPTPIHRHIFTRFYFRVLFLFPNKK
jgi:hypothetical protein